MHNQVDWTSNITRQVWHLAGLYEKSMPLLKTYVLRHALQDFYFWSTVHQTVFPNVLTIGGTDSTLKLINNSYSAAHILLLLL